MFELVSRDGASRRLKGAIGAPAERGGAPFIVETPLVLYVDTPRAPAPAFARVLLAERVPVGERPWIQDRGSRFSSRASDSSAAFAIPADLPYPPSAGGELAAAGEAEGLAAREGPMLVVQAPAGTLPAEVEIVALGSARSLLENPYEFPRRIVALKRRAGPRRLVYAPGCGLPQEIALLAYAGVDLFDSVPAALAARKGEYLTPEGPVPVAAIRAAGPPPCACDACAPGLDAPSALLSHNLWTIEAEARRVRAAIEAGRLRELVEQRIRARPNLSAILRRFDLEEHEYFEEHAPIARDGPLYATSKESLQRPEITRWHRRLELRYEKPESARVLLVLPCSARKPYSASRTHRALERALDGVPNRAAVHEVILTSPLGVVPRELELAYPAAHYDLPVTGHWDEDEKAMIREAVTALVERSRYDHAIVHLEEAEMEIVSEVVPDFSTTVEGDPLAPASLANLRAILTKAVQDLPRVSWNERGVDDLAAIARWQFGEAGRALAEGAEAKGRWPFVKLIDPATHEQLAMLTDRGLLSLTLTGGQRLLDSGAYRVEIENFKPKGTIFGVGIVDADPEIREGDDVVVHHAGELRAVGRALACGRDIAEMKRGGAVSVRRYVGAKE